MIQSQAENSQQGNQQGMISLVKLLKNSMIIFYHLNFQDLHPKFEDNLKAWMTQIAMVLRLNISPQLLNNDDVILFKCKGEALRGILLYATKYREDFMDLIKEFSSEIWNMCTLTNTDQKFDKIVLNSLRYFKNLVICPELKDFFQSNIETLLNTLIVPNLGISTTDKEMFEYEPESFIQSFFEQSDIHSRRSTTVELLKNLCKHYIGNMQNFIQSVIPKYIEKMKQQGGPSQDEEIILINLVIDGSTVAYRTKDGVSEVSLGSELILYFYNNVIKPSLQQMMQASEQGIQALEQKFSPIFICFYLRFFFYFRHFIPKEELLEIIKIISYFCKSSNEGLRDITFYTVQILLSIKDGDIKSYVNLTPHFNKDNIEPQIQTILQNIYSVMEGTEINNYALQSVIVILQLLKENCASYVDPLSVLFKGQLGKIQQGYDFSKALLIFDGLGIFIHYTANGDKSKVAVIENNVSNYLTYILNNNKQMSDLFTFVLQIYALFVQSASENSQNSENYKTFFNSLMDSKNWVEDNQSIFQAYVIYIRGYVQTNQQALYDQIQSFQAILQSVCQMRYDQIFFQIADIICDKLTLDQLRQSGILKMILENAVQFYRVVVSQQTQTDKTPRRNNKPLFVKEFISFICRLIIKHSAMEIIKDFDQINQNLLINLFVEEITLVKLASNRNDRKQLFLALTDLLLNNVQQLNQKNWEQLLNAVIENCGNRFNSYRGVQGLAFVKQQNNVSFSDSGFQKLQALKWSEQNSSINPILSQVQDEDKYFGQEFKKFIQQPQIQQSINFQQILSQKNQETVSKLVQN
ncbi:Armadillo-type fold [Pseudocohnilembus persalinus]|uniref:Armadillo-type fold n=1 Tax=Pseudocohnilembus persalinus TaxID=266149 RepID=A0A0V0Q9T2_PSEPJ|nr:Armadillo-type fold [Pseudocohnilembus persalinus]|eukprot:KRW98823.1 Armadillo-type fold [Pseudocohnilembus persalinus]